MSEKIYTFSVKAGPGPSGDEREVVIIATSLKAALQILESKREVLATRRYQVSEFKTL